MVPKTMYADREEALHLLLRDRRDGDADLLRHLLAEETASHQEGWGVSEALGLAALLLAECGREDDVWALWEAKNASFDTMAGIDGFLLFPAGVAGTSSGRSGPKPNSAEPPTLPAQPCTNRARTSRRSRGETAGSASGAGATSPGRSER